MNVRPSLDILHAIRAASGEAWTVGLADNVVARFAARDPRLVSAIGMAADVRVRWQAAYPGLCQLAERDLCRQLQSRILNFYPAGGINPYVPLAAVGPWIVTSHGAVLHDSGGYGMLGLGHAPAQVVAAIGEPLPMANVMTPSFSQYGLTERLVREIGRTRGACPYGRFVFLNSGSEAVTFACRVSDIRARAMTEPGGRQAGRRIRRLALTDGFHGRTEGPARLSQSCRPAYARHLASFRGTDDLVFVPINDLSALWGAFEDAERSGSWFEAAFVEPVLGEGLPGLAMTPEYYAALRSVTHDAGTLLVVDSIQAALRAQGCLSVVDYPGFESSEPPDMETYSKALNAGQYPLSVVALAEPVAATYVTGLYGNTMTGNARAMEAACVVMDAMTDELRANIRERGRDLVAGLERLSQEVPGAIDAVVGTGLMVSAMLNPARYRVTGEGGVEQHLRRHGIEMIHGGDTGLRFTPPFDITREEVDLILSVVRQGLLDPSLAPAAPDLASSPRVNSPAAATPIIRAMASFDFDEVLDRRDTHSLKWDYCGTAFGLPDVIPMWVADMDFAAPPAVVEAVSKRAAHGAYGYASTPDSFWESVVGWLRDRHGWAVDRRWLARAPGVVPALSLCINAFTSPGDGVVVQTPVYYPFFRAVKENGRRLLRNPLIAEGAHYRMDLAGLERTIDERTRMLILCSPHNPVGRVWTGDELERLGEVCERRNLLVLADEIHMDLTLGGRRHLPFASLSPALADRTITCVAPSKTFNLASLCMSIIVASNPSLLAGYQARFEAAGLVIGSLFGTVALEVAYREGGAWLDELLVYLEGNVDLVERFLAERIPAIRLVRPEGTYLALLDCRQLGLAQNPLDDFFLRQAGVYFDSGPWFGDELQGFERINLACPRRTLVEALERIERAVKSSVRPR